jgi:acyl-CoA reductase-like NAD-dependent aldehyde dehydrogenase
VNFSVIEPATEVILASIPSADESAAHDAVARARAAYPAWRALGPAERARLLYRLADALEAEREELAVLEARNAGKPIGDARGEMGMVIDTFRFYAGAPERTLGDTIPVAGGVAMTFREPLGVVALIVPWNFPLTIAAWKLAPALAAGNTVVLKPAELTPLTALEFERIANGILPEGVVNVVAGPGATAGRALVEHPDVAKVAFTGSTAVGREIAARAAKTTKRVKVGDPLDEETQMGPLISAEHRERVAGYVTGDVAIQGEAPQGPGFWFPPTVLSPADPDSPAVREEIFGPVVAIVPFEDEADAIRLANDTIYGLSGSVWTRDGAKALRVARAVETGVLSINSNTSVRVSTPFGGFKQSGYGRELGPHALDAYTELKTVYYATGG